MASPTVLWQVIYHHVMFYTHIRWQVMWSRSCDTGVQLSAIYSPDRGSRAPLHCHSAGTTSVSPSTYILLQHATTVSWKASNPTKVIDTGNGNANGIAIDFENSRLFWADQMLSTLETCTLDGADHYVIARLGNVLLDITGLTDWNWHNGRLPLLAWDQWQEDLESYQNF